MNILLPLNIIVDVLVMGIGYFSSLVLYELDSPAHLEVRDERAIARKYYGPSQYQVLSLLVLM